MGDIFSVDERALQLYIIIPNIEPDLQPLSSKKHTTLRIVQGQRNFHTILKAKFDVNRGRNILRNILATTFLFYYKEVL